MLNPNFMEHDTSHFNTFLEAATPRQSAPVRSAQLAALIERTKAAPVVSPYMQYATTHRLAFSYVALLLIIVLGTGGTMTAAEAARPGDLLFPVDRASEQLRLLIASPETQQSLNARFLDERWSELLSILDESTLSGSALLTADETIRLAATDWSEATAVRFDAEAFTDVTVVKITAVDQQSYLTTPATTREAVITDMSQRLGLTPDYVAARLSFTIEDRVSAARDYGRVVTAESEDTIVAALGLITATAVELNTDSANDRLRDVLREVTGLQIAGREQNSAENRIRVDTDRIEITTKDGRIRIEQKRDGEVRVRVRDTDDQSDDDQDGDDSDNRDNDEDENNRDSDDDHDDDNRDSGRDESRDDDTDDRTTSDDKDDDKSDDNKDHEDHEDKSGSDDDRDTETEGSDRNNDDRDDRDDRDDHDDKDDTKDERQDNEDGDGDDKDDTPKHEDRDRDSDERSEDSRHSGN
jgi:hypothetical protein